MNTQIISGNRSSLTCIFLLTSEHRLRTGWRIVITLLGFVAVLLNGNSLPHDLTFPDFDAHTAIVAGKGQ